MVNSFLMKDYRRVPAFGRGSVTNNRAPMSQV